MKAQHTPGPWSQGRQLSRSSYRVNCKDGYHVAGVRGAANTALIAAAPDLLELCHRALLALDEDSFPALREELRTAIAKATGETA